MRITLLYLWLMLALIASLATLTSCSEKNVKEKLPATYFDATFGMSSEEVTACFEKNGLKLQEEGSNDLHLTFLPSEGDSIVFAGMVWNQMNAGFYKQKFLLIDLYSIHENDSVAEQDYNRILSVLKEKWAMEEIDYQAFHEDSLTLKCSGYNDGDRAMSLTLRKGHTNGNEARWFCDLQFCNPNIADETPKAVKVIDHFRRLTQKRK